MIFTCNFANWKKIPVPVVPIAVCRYLPKGLDIASYPPLFPPEDLLKAYKNGQVNDGFFKETYTRQVLNKLDVSKVVIDLYDMDCGLGSVVLLCYESSDKFCHRHLIRDWLISHGMTSQEFAVKRALKNPLGLLRKYHD